MAYNPLIHHRKSIRLKGFDYTQAGLYFITICAQNRACLFGEIRRDDPIGSPQMVLNDAGEMVNHWYNELNHKYDDIECHAMVVMPNHFHCIIQIIRDDVGADLRVCPNNRGVCPNNRGVCPNNRGVCPDYRGVCPDNQGERPDIRGEHAGSPLRCYPDISDKRGNGVEPTSITGERVGTSIRDVVQWFKTMTTNYYIRGVKQNGWPPFDGKLWQRNYWEHIIRNQNEYERISQYIINNPQQWDIDKLK